MTELLHSREYRQRQLKEIIRELHQGASVEQVKERFNALIKDVGPGEIANLEQALIKEGLPEKEIKRLCDVHVAVFKEALNQQTQADTVPGHPLHTFRQENRAIAQLVERLQALLETIKPEAKPAEEKLAEWRRLHQDLLQVEKHYSRKENVLFPYLEKYGISGPPGVMWSIHDEIRDRLQQTSRLLASARPGQPALRQALEQTALPMLTAIREMIYKEEKILFPMSLELLTEQEWAEVRDAGGEIGYTLIEPGQEWQPRLTDAGVRTTASRSADVIALATGALSPRQLDFLLRTLPGDITFVDADNVVRYYSQGKERIFARTPAIIGRKVEKCHPPESVHVVEQIVRDFRTGKRDNAEFWIELGGKFIYIRYFPVRDDDGEYLGVLEVTQDVTRIRQLQGQKRLLDEPTQD